MTGIHFLIDQIYSLYEIPIRYFEGQQCKYQPASRLQEADPLLYDQVLLQSLLDNWDGIPRLELTDGIILYGVCKDIRSTACIIGPVSLTPIGSKLLHKYKNNHGLMNFNDFSISSGSLTRTAAALALIHKEMNGEMLDSLEMLEAYLKK